MRFISQGCNSLLILLLISITCCISPEALRSAFATSGQTGSVPPVSSSISIDPDIVDSEWNHHLAGYTLISIALLVLASHRFLKLAFLRALWPFLFAAAGLYLLAWSDKEIWPRGFLSWTWLIHHDAEARQHKIYSVLLLTMCAIEYLRWRGKLGCFGRKWAFPLLALIGACLLLVHEHGGNSGLSPGWDNAQKSARIAEIAHAAGENLMPASLTSPNRKPEHAIDMPVGHHEMADMMMSSPAHPNGSVSPSANSASHPHSGHTGHVMTSSMLHIKAQHLWFTFVGVAVALFKFIEDGRFWRKRFVPYLWPSAMLVLGILLARYTEVM